MKNLMQKLLKQTIGVATLCCTALTLFALDKPTDVLYDNGVEFISENGKALPSPRLWKSQGVQVVSGIDKTNCPPLPNLPTLALNDSTLHISGPVFCLNRKNGDNEPVSYPSGDVLESNNIDLSTVRKAVLCFNVHRCTKRKVYSTGWADSVLVGPEARVVIQEDVHREAPLRSGLQGYDELRVDFSCVSDDGSHNIFDADTATSVDWRIHPRAGQDPERGCSAYALFGGGGYRVGYDQQNPDSVLNAEQGLRADLYDDGKDDLWKTVFIQVPDTFLHAPHNASKNFRFRFAVAAFRNGQVGGPVDDDDDFYVKNIRLLTDTTQTDVQLNGVAAYLPEQEITQTSHSRLHVELTLANVSIKDAGGVSLQVECTQADGSICSVVTTSLPFLVGLRDVRIPLSCRFSPCTMSNGFAEFYIKARVDVPARKDVDHSNNELRSEHYSVLVANTISSFTSTDTNNVERFAVEKDATTQPGYGLCTPPSLVQDGGLDAAFGAHSQAAPGALAWSFVIDPTLAHFVQKLVGFQVLFPTTALASSRKMDLVLYAADSVTGLPSERVLANVDNIKRGIDMRAGTSVHDTLSTYLLSAPLNLINDTAKSFLQCWIALHQRDSLPLNVAGTGYGLGMQTLSIDSSGSGQHQISVFLNKSYRWWAGSRRENTISAVYTPTNSSLAWKALSPSHGHPLYAHLDNVGSVRGFATYSQGIVMPMIRPLFADFNLNTGIDESDESAGAKALGNQWDGGLHASPNPCSTETHIEFFVPQESMLKFEIVDLRGKTVFEGERRLVPAGARFVRWMLKDMNDHFVPDGLYFCYLHLDNHSFSMPLLVQR